MDCFTPAIASMWPADILSYRVAMRQNRLQLTLSVDSLDQLLEDPDPWRKQAAKLGFSSIAAICGDLELHYPADSQLIS